MVTPSRKGTELEDAVAKAVLLTNFDETHVSHEHPYLEMEETQSDSSTDGSLIKPSLSDTNSHNQSSKQGIKVDRKGSWVEALRLDELFHLDEWCTGPKLSHPPNGRISKQRNVTNGAQGRFQSSPFTYESRQNSLVTNSDVY